MVAALVADLAKLDWSKATPLQTDYRRNEIEGATNDILGYNTALRITSNDGKSYPVVTSHNGEVGSIPFSSNTLFVREETIVDANGKKLPTPRIEYSIHEIGEPIPRTLEHGLVQVTSADQIASVALPPQEVPFLRRGPSAWELKR